MTARITGIVPLNGDTVSNVALASLRGAEPIVCLGHRWEESVGRALVTGASIDGGGDLRLTVEYPDDVIARLAERQCDTDSLKRLGMGYTATGVSRNDGARDFTGLRLMEIGPDLEQPPAAPVASPGADRRVHCSRCGKPVSNDLGVVPIVRAWVECPECVERHG